MTETDDFAEGDLHACDDCGVSNHLFSWECRFNLHGMEDSFKTSCAVCSEEIPSLAPRETDRFGNLYCTQECALAGKDELLEMVMDRQSEVKASV